MRKSNLMTYVPDRLHQPVAKNFTRRLIDTSRIESTCNRCHETITGDVSSAHSENERRHENICGSSGEMRNALLSARRMFTT
jgi:hypothetical protein